jgi:hypothetical protein
MKNYFYMRHFLISLILDASSNLLFNLDALLPFQRIGKSKSTPSKQPSLCRVLIRNRREGGGRCSTEPAAPLAGLDLRNS